MFFCIFQEQMYLTWLKQIHTHTCINKSRATGHYALIICKSAQAITHTTENWVAWRITIDPVSQYTWKAASSMPSLWCNGTQSRAADNWMGSTANRPETSPRVAPLSSCQSFSSWNRNWEDDEPAGNKQIIWCALSLTQTELWVVLLGMVLTVLAALFCNVTLFIQKAHSLTALSIWL